MQKAEKPGINARLKPLRMVPFRDQGPGVKKLQGGDRLVSATLLRALAPELYPYTEGVLARCRTRQSAA